MVYALGRVPVLDAYLRLKILIPSGVKLAGCPHSSFTWLTIYIKYLPPHDFLSHGPVDLILGHRGSPLYINVYKIQPNEMPPKFKSSKAFELDPNSFIPMLSKSYNCPGITLRWTQFHLPTPFFGRTMNTSVLLLYDMLHLLHGQFHYNHRF